MRIYFDSNIFRKIKPGSNQFKPELAEAATQVFPYFIFPFSDSHLTDLSTSKETFRNEDLLFMEKFVKDNFIHRDHVKKEINYSLVTPKDAYNAYDFTVTDNLQQSIATIFEDLFNFEGGDEFRSAFQQLLEFPILPPQDFDTEKLPVSVKQMIESFKDIRSMKDAMKAIGGMGDFIDDKSFVNHNRRLFEGYIDRDDYSFEKWSFEFDERLKETYFCKSLSELVEQMTTQSEQGDPYHRVLNTYVALETFGITQERTGKKQQLKKNSFSDLHKDAAHVFFASKSDYFVSDDLCVQQKAFIVYKILGIDTQVLSPENFIEQTKMLVKNEGGLDWLTEQLTATVNLGAVLHYSENERVTLREVAPALMNYFNRYQVNNYPRGGGFQLFRNCQKQTTILFSEIALIIDKVSKIFGKPVELSMLDYSTAFSQYEIGRPIRVWDTGDMMLSIQLEKDNHNKPLLLLSFIPLSAPTDSSDIKP